MRKLSKKEKKKIKEKKRLIKLEKKKERKKLNIDFNSILGGLFVGIANIIPGVSGGTMLVIFNLFDKLTYAVSDVFKRHTSTRKQSIILLAKVLISAAIGILLFAKILGFTLKYYEAETIMCFMGLILFSVPIVVKKELKDQKLNIPFFIIGVVLIGILEYFNLKGTYAESGSGNGPIDYLILSGLGIIGGITMIFPGISGSMIMLVLGKYEMIRSYIDQVTTLDVNVFIKLGVLGIGVLLGIVLSSKLLSSLLKKHKVKTISLILGFIIASALILPLNLDNPIKLSAEKVCGLLVSFVLGGIIIYYLNKLEKKNSD